MFQKVIEEISMAKASGCLLCPEILLDVVTDYIAPSDEVYFLARSNADVKKDEGGTIIPSLSIYKLPGERAKLLQNYDNLWSNIRKDDAPKIKEFQPRSVPQIAAYAKVAKYSVYKYNNKRVLILAKQQGSASNDKFRELAGALDAVISQSQNIRNDSRMRADQDRSRIEFSAVQKEAAIEISRYVSEQYGTHCEAFGLDNSSKNFAPLSDSSDLGVQYSVGVKADQLKNEQRPLTCWIKGVYYLIFPFLSPLAERDLRYLIVVGSPVPIPEYVSANLVYFTNYYFAVVLAKEKSKILDTLSSGVVNAGEAVTAFIDSGETALLNKLLPRFLGGIFSSVIDVTNAISITIRVLNEDTDKLERVVTELSDNAVLDDELCSQAISIKDQQSQVALTFRKGEVQDIKDLSNLKSKYRKKSTNKIPYRAHRLNALSELCYPIYYHGRAIGTLNFESAIRRAFVNDEPFLRGVKDSVQAYIEAIYAANDKHWLARRSRVYQNLHEIKAIIANVEFPDKFREEIDNYIILNETVESSTDTTRLRTLCDRIRSMIQAHVVDMSSTYFAYMRERQSQAFVSRINIDNSLSEKENLPIPRYKLNMIVILIRNVVGNLRKHGPHSSRVDISLNDEDELHIRMSSDLYAAEHKDKILLEPFTSSVNGETRAHYGTFIIGMIARHLGGVATLKHDESKVQSVLNVYIPIRIDR